MLSNTVTQLVSDEIARAKAQHQPIHSFHEGYAILLEEVNELWDEVRRAEQVEHRIVSEAVQVAATAMLLLEQLCSDQAAEGHISKIARFDQLEREIAKANLDSARYIPSSCYSG